MGAVSGEPQENLELRQPVWILACRCDVRCGTFDSHLETLRENEMTYLLRAEALTNYVHVVRQAGLDPYKQ